MNRRKILISGAMAVGAVVGTALLPGGLRKARAALPSLEEMLAEKSMGQADAPVTMHAYESLTCPHCRSFHLETLPDLKAQYVDTGKLRIVFHDVLRNQRDLFAVMLARCSGNNYFPMLDALYQNQASWAQAPGDQFMQTLQQYGGMGGMNQQDFNACMNNNDLAQALIQRSNSQGRELGIQSTPTFIIGEERITGAQPLPVFQGILEPMLEE